MSPSPANVTQVVVDRSIEINRTGAPDASPIDYLKLTIDRKAPGVFYSLDAGQRALNRSNQPAGLFTGSRRLAR